MSPSEQNPVDKKPWVEPELKKLSVEATAGGSNLVTYEAVSPVTSYRPS